MITLSYNNFHNMEVEGTVDQRNKVEYKAPAPKIKVEVSSGATEKVGA